MAFSTCQDSSCLFSSYMYVPLHNRHGGIGLGFCASGARGLAFHGAHTQAADTRSSVATLQFFFIRDIPGFSVIFICLRFLPLLTGYLPRTAHSIMRLEDGWDATHMPRNAPLRGRAPPPRTRPTDRLRDKVERLDLACGFSSSFLSVSLGFGTCDDLTVSRLSLVDLGCVLVYRCSG